MNIMVGGMESITMMDVLRRAIRVRVSVVVR